MGVAIVTSLAEAKRRNFELIWLDVRITNVAAIELFRKLGFRTWGIFPTASRRAASTPTAVHGL